MLRKSLLKSPWLMVGSDTQHYISKLLVVSNLTAAYEPAFTIVESRRPVKVTLDHSMSLQAPPALTPA